jgi:hypothetical protein
VSNPQGKIKRRRTPAAAMPHRALPHAPRQLWRWRACATPPAKRAALRGCRRPNTRLNRVSGPSNACTRAPAGEGRGSATVPGAGGACGALGPPARSWVSPPHRGEEGPTCPTEALACARASRQANMPARARNLGSALRRERRCDRKQGTLRAFQAHSKLFTRQHGYTGRAGGTPAVNQTPVRPSLGGTKSGLAPFTLRKAHQTLYTRKHTHTRWHVRRQRNPIHRQPQTKRG